ncbi:MAG: single-stranded DNA-binding protein [Spirochaetales bacterium]|nr:MAG: single-stranded DNA-binding protein [Spirochaetales bacterium]
MNNLNSVILEGNLTKDPVMSKTPQGTAVCRFTVASNRFYKTQGERREEVSFFDVETWSRLAENCAEYLHQGRGVRVVGRLKQDRWKSEEGTSHSKIHIVGEHVEFRAYPQSRKTDEADSAAAESRADTGEPAEKKSGKQKKAVEAPVY